MAKLIVAIVRGGPSDQYDQSLLTGGAVLKALGTIDDDSYSVRDIVISRDGAWHVGGLPRSPERALAGVDVAWNALHGTYGEDGKVQKVLQSFSVPYAGSDPVASAYAMNKAISRERFKESGIKTPYYTVVRPTDELPKKISYIFEHFFLPVIVKPAAAGGSVGVSLVEDISDLEAALAVAFQFSEAALVEEFVRGREASVAVIPHFRSQWLYTTLPVEIRYPAAEKIYAHKAKVEGAADLISPGQFSEGEKSELQRLAREIHQSLGLGHYSQTDFIVTPHRGIYVLETNTQPSLAEHSPFILGLHSVGSNLPEFLEHVLGQVREK